MWNAEDLDSLIDPDLPGYALGVLADQSEVPGLFRNGAAEAFGIGGSNPVFRCVHTSAPSRNQTIVLHAVTYKVARIDPDGNGFARLQLEKQ